jgi:hypothetical protein
MPYGNPRNPRGQLLQSAGLIRYRRGHIQILDRPALEELSCECYAIVRGMMVAGDCDDGVRQAIAIKIIELAKAGERKFDLSFEGVVENFRERVQMSG